MIGVVVPTLNESETLPALLQDLRKLADMLPLDTVVVDGGSSEDTLAQARAAGARVLEVTRGRARQLNAGAQAAQGEWLLFLHADCRLTDACRTALVASLEGQLDLQAAVFRFAIDLPPGWKQLIEWGQRVRQAVIHLPYGDQGLLVRRSLFIKVGGFPDIPLMEDVALVRRLQRESEVRILPAALPTSGRRYLLNGVVRTGLLHTVLMLLYTAGVSPHRLSSIRDAVSFGR